jgi:putative ABC transport system permease protein
MIKNYFKIAWRVFVKDRTYAIINLAGLAIALASVLIIGAFVKYELSFDKYYSNSNRIFRIVADEQKDSIVEKTFMMPSALCYTLKDEFPEIESVVTISKTKRDFLVNGKTFTIESIDTDSSFFHIFNLPFISGNPSSVLINNRNIVLTERTAKKLFPHENPIGKQIAYKSYNGVTYSYSIAGIIKDIPANTHFTAEAIIASTKKQDPLTWRAFSSGGVQYIMLKKGADIKELQKKIPSIRGKYNFRDGVTLSFQPVTSVHLHSHIKGEPFINSDIKYVYIFSFAAILILLLACINYINLTTARSLQRIKEVGMRKVMGAAKKQLAFQFITESVLFFLFALPLAYLIAFLFWPSFTGITDLHIGTSALLNYKFISLILLLGLISGFISGAYPAFFLSRLKPISVLKDWQKGFRLNLSIRKTLIVFQFVISIALIISTVVIYKQLHLLNNLQLGFNKDYLVTLPPHQLADNTAAFKNELKSNKDILNVSVSAWNISRGYGSSSSMSQPNDSLKDWNFGFVSADTDFLKTMQIKLIAGRNFNNTDIFNVDSLSQAAGKKSNEEKMDIISLKDIIITKTTAQNLGLKEPVVGQVIKLGALQGTVVGVINDFIGVSLLEKNPMVVIEKASKLPFGSVYIRINSKNIPQTIDFIKSKWKQFYPSKNFEFSFIDDDIAALYKAQQQLATLFTAFASLAILISLMGLFSLVALIVQQKTKEIGIRKVLGASVTEIVSLLSAGFIKLIIISLIIASPIVWWTMNIWLQDFQYRISISWWIFIIAGLGSLCFALIVVSVQAIKAAMANPVKSLRTE